MTPEQICAKLACIDIYPKINRSQFDYLFRIGETVCGVTITKSGSYITLQGSVGIDDWIDDLDILPKTHKILGDLHSGFDYDLPELVNSLIDILPANIAIFCCGHSAGAAKAAILAARLTLQGYRIAHIYLFGSPNPGCDKFSQWMQNNIRGSAFWNKHPKLSFLCDPVPGFPTKPYSQIYKPIPVISYPKGIKKLFPTCWHNAKLYYAAIIP